jgi:hypothetical protein
MGLVGLGRGPYLEKSTTSTQVRLHCRDPTLAAEAASAQPYFLVKTKCFSMFEPTSFRWLQYALKPPL